MLDYTLVCTKCGTRFSRSAKHFRCPDCNAVLEVTYHYSRNRPKIMNWKPLRMVNYIEFLPIKGRLFGPAEGGTPLVKLKKTNSIGKNATVYIKDETGNPTSSFKDRGTAIEITKAMELGFDHICCASTGNMALSISTYARLAGINATVFISKDANADKIRRISKQGPKIKKINGDFNRAADLAEAFARKNNFFLCGDYHYRKEGQKTVGFEIAEQLHYKVPDYIVVQVGNGTLLAAIYKGLAELKRFGLINRLPRIIAVQSSSCDPLIRAIEGKHSIKYVKPRTYADAIAVGFPTFGFECMKAIKNTNGGAVSVSDTEIEEARKILYKRSGIRTEPGGAAGFAGLIKFAGSKNIDGKTVVCIATGNNERWR